MRIDSARVNGTITMTYRNVFQSVDHITGSLNIVT